MSEVKIRSRVARPLSFALPHRPCCIALGRCRCKAGVPPTVQICQPHGIASVEESDLGAPDLQRALKVREIVVLQGTKATRAAAVVPVESPRPSGRRRSS